MISIFKHFVTHNSFEPPTKFLFFVTYTHIEWWYHAVYFPRVGISINIHPNRFKQMWEQKVLCRRSPIRVGQRLG